MPGKALISRGEGRWGAVNEKGPPCVGTLPHRIFLILTVSLQSSHLRFTREKIRTKRSSGITDFPTINKWKSQEMNLGFLNSEPMFFPIYYG